MAQLLLSYPSAGSSILKYATYGRRSALEKARWACGNHHAVHCCSTSTSSVKEVGLLDKVEKERKMLKEDDFEYLVGDFGWKVRRLAVEEGEMRQVAAVQAEAFHTPVFLLDDLFFEFFKAEVLSGLLYKLRNSPPNRYACLVAEPSNEVVKSQQKLVGIVDVTVLRDESVLQRLQGAEEYLYVSGLAVSKSFRRRKVASVLLKACDMLAMLWGLEYLALRAYEDDVGARKLYSNAGYQVVSGDPPWFSTWIGRKRRVLLIKRIST